MDRVAAEIAEKVGVLFQHLNLASGPGEQQPGHDPCRAAASDHHVEF
jgi:hypothetical protein